MNITDYYPDYIEIGYTKKTFGVKGRLKFVVEGQYIASIIDVEHAFFVMKGCMVPYFIVNDAAERADGVIKFESTNDPESAKILVSKSIYLHKDQILASDYVAEGLAFDYLKGMQMYNDNNQQLIGVVDNIVEYPEQEIAIVIDQNEKEYLIPVNVFNVIDVKMEESKVYIDIPEGLLDL